MVRYLPLLQRGRERRFEYVIRTALRHRGRGPISVWFVWIFIHGLVEETNGSSAFSNSSTQLLSFTTSLINILPHQLLIYYITLFISYLLATFIINNICFVYGCWKVEHVWVWKEREKVVVVVVIGVLFIQGQRWVVTLNWLIFGVSLWLTTMC